MRKEPRDLVLCNNFFKFRWSIEYVFDESRIQDCCEVQISALSRLYELQ